MHLSVATRPLTRPAGRGQKYNGADSTMERISQRAQFCNGPDSAMEPKSQRSENRNGAKIATEPMHTVDFAMGQIQIRNEVHGQRHQIQSFPRLDAHRCIRNLFENQILNLARRSGVSPSGARGGWAGRLGGSGISVRV